MNSRRTGRSGCRSECDEALLISKPSVRCASMTSRQQKLSIALGIYVCLWLATGIGGLPQVDRAFDKEFATGSPDAFETLEHPAQIVPIPRVAYVRIIDPERQSTPEIPFRARSLGAPIAPFLILDEACVAETPLAAFSGRRLVFWFFGCTGWIPLKTWWVS